jgi:hypothetical protein
MDSLSAEERKQLAREHNEELNSFVDNLSSGNIRRALDFLNAFIGSGHVNATKILDKYNQQGSYTIPVHEFMRAVIYDDHEHYDPSTSPIANLFDISTPDGREHFLLGNTQTNAEGQPYIGKVSGSLQ